MLISCIKSNKDRKRKPGPWSRDSAQIPAYTLRRHGYPCSGQDWQGICPIPGMSTAAWEAGGLPPPAGPSRQAAGRQGLSSGGSFAISPETEKSGAQTV